LNDRVPGGRRKTVAVSVASSDDPKSSTSDLRLARRFGLLVK
jgi:hypothetical protein